MTTEPSVAAHADEKSRRGPASRLRITLFEHDDGTRTGVELTLLVCSNSDCPCTSMTLEGHAFSKLPGEDPVADELALRLVHDVATHKTEGFPRGRTAGDVGMIEELKKVLRRKATKDRLRNAFDEARARLEPMADLTYDFAANHDGTLAYYYAVYPDAEPVYVDVEGVRYAIDDAWCVRPACSCVEGVVALCTETEQDDDERTLVLTPVATIRVPGGVPVHSPSEVTSAMRTAVMSEHVQQTLARHRTRVRAEAAKRWGVERPRTKVSAPVTPAFPAPVTGVVAGSSAKVGRNDRCPCGSGKKFKHCCLRRG